jgi:hypothetical protein
VKRLIPAEIPKQPRKHSANEQNSTTVDTVLSTQTLIGSAMGELFARTPFNQDSLSLDLEYGLYEHEIDVSRHRDDELADLTTRMQLGGAAPGTRFYTIVLRGDLNFNERETNALADGIFYGRCNQLYIQDATARGSIETEDTIFAACALSGNITRVTLERVNLIEWKCLLEWISSHMASVTELRLQNIDAISNEESTLVRDALLGSSSIETLIMVRCKIAGRVMALFDGLKNGGNVHLKKLIVHECNIGDEDAVALVAGAPEKLMELRMRENDITGDGAVAVVAKAHLNRSIKWLDLSGNRRIGYVGMRRIAAFLSENWNEGLEYLNMEECCTVAEEEENWYKEENPNRLSAERLIERCGIDNWKLRLDCVTGNNFDWEFCDNMYFYQSETIAKWRKLFSTQITASRSGVISYLLENEDDSWMKSCLTYYFLTENNPNV